MVILRGMTPVAGGIYLEVLDGSEPDVLTMFISPAPPEGRTVPVRGVRHPEDEREAWIFDLDAIKETQPQVAGAFPAWASGKISVEPTLVGSTWRFVITPEMLAS
jgi:hypothetical protein